VARCLACGLRIDRRGDRDIELAKRSRLCDQGLAIQHPQRAVLVLDDLELGVEGDGTAQAYLGGALDVPGEDSR
jgi:hypothetical protein